MDNNRIGKFIPKGRFLSMYGGWLNQLSVLEQPPRLTAIEYSRVLLWKRVVPLNEALAVERKPDVIHNWGSRKAIGVFIWQQRRVFVFDNAGRFLMEVLPVEIQRTRQLVYRTESWIEERPNSVRAGMLRARVPFWKLGFVLEVDEGERVVHDAYGQHSEGHYLTLTRVVN